MHGRLNSFFNSGFARTGNRSVTLDVINQGTVAADSLTTTFNLSNYPATDQIWLDLYFKKQSTLPPYAGNQIWIRGNDQAAWIPVKSLSDPADPTGVYIHVNVDVSGTLAKAVTGANDQQQFPGEMRRRRKYSCGISGRWRLARRRNQFRRLSADQIIG